MNRTIRFLTGSQSLYGEQVLQQVAAQSRQVVAALSEAKEIAVPIVWEPVLIDSDSIRKALMAASRDESCIGVIAWMHTFSPAKMWISGLAELNKPLLHLHTQANLELPWSTIDMDFMNLNQAAHGDREFGYVQTRMRIPRVTVVGHATDERTRARVASWARVAAGIAELRSLRVARFGDNMRGVAVTEGDKVEAERHFGVSVNTYGVNDLVEVVEQVADPDIDSVVEQCLDLYQVAPELAPSGARHQSLRYAARIECGLRTFLTTGGFGAFTTNFEDLGGLRQLPGLAVQRLMGDGYGFGGEGDWKTAVLLRTFKTIGADRPGGTSFMEDYTYHLGPGPQRVLGAHMLEVCPSISDARPTVEIHPLSIGNREDPVRLRFTAAPGEAVVVGMADLGDRFRLVGNVITVIPPDEELSALPVASATWEPHPDLPTSAECWLSAGGPHHTVLSTQVDVNEVRQLADLTGTELVMIDSQTDLRGFTNELRWNSAYFRLAAGL